MSDRLRLIEKIEFIKRDAEAGHQWANPHDIATLCDMALASLDDTRATPATPSHDRMADVRLGAEAALEHTYPKMSWVPEFAARIAATVTLPDAKGCEAKGEHTCGTSHANTPSADRVREKALREGYLLAMADGFPMTASEAGQMERLIQEALNKKGEA